MRVLFLSAVMILAGVQSATQANTGIVEGIVTRQGTSEPIPNVQVALTAGSGARLTGILTSALPSSTLTPELLESRMAAAEGSAGIPVRFTTTTDDAGRFSFRDLPLGDYFVSAYREGYFGPTLPNGAMTTVVASAVVVSRQQATPAVALSLTPNATVSGRILNDNGQRIPDIRVSAYLATYGRDGRMALVPMGLLTRMEARATTNDRGEYRLFNLPPGEYYIGVMPPPATTSTSPQGAYVTTFYPNAVDANLASPLLIRGGEEVIADVPIQRFPTVKISGTIASTLSGVTRPVTRFYLMPRKSTGLAEVDPPTFVNTITDAASLAAGKFEIHGVRPGTYDLMAVLAPFSSAPEDPASRPMGNPIPGRVQVDVGNRDLEGVVLPVHPGVDVKIRLTFEGDVAAFRKESIRPYLWAKENWASPFEVAMYHPGQARGPRRRPGEPAPVAPPLVDSTGAYTYSNVAEATYIIEMLGLPPTAYVADIQQAGVGTIYDNGFIVGANPPGDIQVFINTVGATAEGTVNDGGQRPRPNAQVALVPHSSRRQNRFLYKLAQTDASGHFTMQGVAPGEYKLFAWEGIPASAHLNADFIARYESRGQNLHVVQGSPVLALQLELIPVAADRQ